LATRPDPAEKAPQLPGDSPANELSGWNKTRERVERAFSRDEFILYQQRIHALRGEQSETTFVELLVRHVDEERHLTPPGAFLPVLEHYNMMPELDRWVTRRMLRWHASHAGERLMLFSINATPQTLMDSSLPEYIEEHLVGHDVPASVLCFEIPLSELMAHLQAMRPVLRSLKALGCRIAIGGVGRELVSFKPIQSVRADFVKLDGALVLQLNRDAGAYRKVHAIGRVCRAHGMRTIAECVEESDTLEKLKSMGIDYAQGFGLSQPAPLTELE
jgi:EAL domain-containing protein (putative c-di-GMP-specific phosphodiesterase class I)